MIKTKLIAIRENAQLSQKDFAKRLGISFRTLQNYEYGKSSPTIDFIQKVSATFFISPEYFFKEDNSDYTHQTLNDDDIIHIPIYNVYASAGEGYINEETLMQHISLNKALLKHYFGLSSCKDLSVITARGDSMHPVIPENSQLLMQKKEVGDGQICITRIDNELYVKRLQKLPKYKLISDNKCYDDIELEGKDYEIIGVVVGLFQKI